MRKLQLRMNLNPNRTGVVGVAIAVAIMWLNPRAAQADITNIIWQAKLAGNLAIQRYDANLQPRISIAKFVTRDFISMVTGGTATATNQVLGVNLVMSGGQTNFYLSIYNSANRENSQRITTNEVATWVSDGKNLTFTVEAPMPPMLSTNGTWGGGIIRIAGVGHMVKGVPAGLSGAVEGMFIDNRPNDLLGTTGLVVQARISTFNAPLRVQPSN